MDPLNQLDHTEDTTLFLAKEALSRGYQVYAYSPEALSLKENSLTAIGGRLNYSNSVWKQGTPQILDFKNVHIVLVRQEPPFDMAYITSTYLLDFLPKKCVVVNNPRVLRDLPEKIIPHYFEKYLAPTLISSNYEEMVSFLKKYKEVVIKPLYLYGGKGVQRIDSEIKIKKYLEKNDNKHIPRIMQKFLSSVETQGDKRLVFIEGKLRGWLQRRPARGGFLTNFYEGATAEKCDLTSGEKKLSQDIETFLQEKKIYFAGIDIIDNYLLEVNITCPATLPTLKKLCDIDLGKLFWDGLEKRVK